MKIIKTLLRAGSVPVPFVLLLLSFILSGCVPVPARKPAGTAVPAFRQVPPEKFPRFSDAIAKEGFYLAAERSSSYLDSLSKKKKKFYQVGHKRVTPGLLADSIREFVKILKGSKDEEELNRRIKNSFDLFQLAGSDGKGKVVFSSYYEPLFKASLEKTGEYPFPIYARPSDMVVAELELFNKKKWKGEKVVGRVKDGKFVPYFTREQIDFKDRLAGRGLELAWLKNRADIMDLHIEGSGRLKLPDGTMTKALYAATNGLPFKGWMTLLVNSGAIPRDEITHERAKKYLAEHPDAEAWILSRNRRYTFFRLAPVTDPDEGPFGTMGAPIVGGRSVAVDPQIVPLGALAYIEVPMPRVSEGGKVLGITPDSRFVLCQDTGGAIKGAGRVDFFAGHGAKARGFAFNLWESGKLYLLLLKFPAGGEI